MLLGINAVRTAKKGMMSMPDIRKVDDDYEIVIHGRVIRYESYDEAYSLWEEA